jgi:hypothetical protein
MQPSQERRYGGAFVGADGDADGSAPALTKKRFRLFCCREGLAAVPLEHALGIQERALAGTHPLVVDGQDDVILLPRCRTRDELLREPALIVDLSEDDIAYMTASTVDGFDYPIAATCFGPDEQDKLKNEDFALAAVIKTHSGLHAFAAVADGVSTKTFWAERAARLACIAAYETVRDYIPHWESSGIDALAAEFRDALARRILKAFERDRDLLLSYPKIRPLGWAPTLHDQYIEDRSYWYNSTLLVAYLGLQKGLVCFAGDGGVKIIKSLGDGAPQSQKDEIVPLKSTEEMEINSYVSLAGIKDLRVGIVTYLPNLNANIKIYLASDGPDRSLQRGNIEGGLSVLAADSSPHAAAHLEKLWNEEFAEHDNYSFAQLEWPMPIFVSNLPPFIPKQPQDLDAPLGDPIEIQPVSEPELPGKGFLEPHPVQITGQPIETASSPRRLVPPETVTGTTAASPTGTEADQGSRSAKPTNISIENFWRDLCLEIDRHCKKKGIKEEDRYFLIWLVTENVFGRSLFERNRDRIQMILQDKNIQPNGKVGSQLLWTRYCMFFNYKIGYLHKLGGPYGRSSFDRGEIWQRLLQSSPSFAFYVGNDRSRNWDRSRIALTDWLHAADAAAFRAETPTLPR